MPSSPDVVVVGAGVVGAACAYHLAAAGVRVRLLDRSYVASGSSGACEGNVLAWDKELERELPLALRSADLWQQLADRAPRRLRVRPQGQRRRRRDRGRDDRLAPSAPACSPASACTARCSTPPRCAARSRTPRTTCRAASCTPATPSSSRVSPPPRSSAPPSRAGAELSLDTEIGRIVREPSAARPASRPRPASSPPAPSSSPRASGRELLATCGLNVPVTPRKGQIVVLERSPVVLPPQAQRGGLRRRRRGRRRRTADRDGRRVRRPPAPRCSAPPASTSASTARSTSPSPARSPPAPRASSRSSRRPRAARLRRPAPADPGPHPDHRPVRRSAEPLRRHRPRGRRHRPRAGHGRARRRLVHGRPARGPALLVLAGPLRPGGARRLVIELTVDGTPLQAPAGQSLAAALLCRRPHRAARLPFGHAAGALLRHRRLPGVPRRRRRRGRPRVRHARSRRGCA